VAVGTPVNTTAFKKGKEFLPVPPCTTPIVPVIDALRVSPEAVVVILPDPTTLTFPETGVAIVESLAVIWVIPEPEGVVALIVIPFAGVALVIVILDPASIRKLPVLSGETALTLCTAMDELFAKGNHFAEAPVFISLNTDPVIVFCHSLDPGWYELSVVSGSLAAYITNTGVATAVLRGLLGDVVLKLLNVMKIILKR